MTVRREAFGALTTLILGMPTACAGTQDHVLSFEPGEHQARVRDLRIDLVKATYAERELTIECAITNTGDAAVTVEREGVLLDDDGLEIPPVTVTGQPPEFIVPAGGATVMQFAFAIGGLEPHVRTLGLWAIRSPSAPLRPLRLEVPGIRSQST